MPKPNEWVLPYNDRGGNTLVEWLSEKGFTNITPTDENFCKAKPPEGWTRKPGWSMDWTEVYDENGFLMFNAYMHIRPGEVTEAFLDT